MPWENGEMNTQPDRNSDKVTERVNAIALELLDKAPEGIRWSELNKAIKNEDPSLHPKTINGGVWKLIEKFPDRVYKSGKGIFRSTKFRSH